ncbi:MAG: hypothetical protein QN172_03740 [Armatimonadota bacterium]|nr:hypothetical protein [Armatimonadota bacterium]MDR7439970.1 hypothetical protein [Armatimonadota bacterium]MDR7562364.1 hypothetical protein [Armatimonadota bacterium]MDR7567235.1 hypothetical protein [Armatimonadota bacterium]MDR7601553.1 hypothetical protein [Armatimonadota bacterium]
MRTRFLKALLLILGLALIPGRVSASKPLLVSGRVVHGETGRPVGGTEIRVLGMSAGREPQEQVARTDAAGRFAVRMDPSFRAYAVQAFYRGVAYTVGPLKPTDGQLEVTVRVYETTRDPRGLLLARRALLLEPVQEGVLEVREVVVLANRAPRTYVGSEGGTVRIALPSGAREVSVQQGMVPLGLDADGALVDSLPVTPGLREMVFFYRIPYWTSRIYLTLPVTLPVATLDVFAPEPLEARSEALPRREGRTVQGKRILRIWGENLPTGRAVVLEVSGLAAPSRILPGLVVGVLVLVGVGAAALPWIRGSSARA